MSIEIIPDPLSANLRYLSLCQRLREKKPEGIDLFRLVKEISQAQRLSFSEIPLSQMAKNVTPIKTRLVNNIKLIIRGVAQR